MSGISSPAAIGSPSGQYQLTSHSKTKASAACADIDSDLDIPKSPLPFLKERQPLVGRSESIFTETTGQQRQVQPFADYDNDEDEVAPRGKFCAQQ